MAGTTGIETDIGVVYAGFSGEIKEKLTEEEQFSNVLSEISAKTEEKTNETAKIAPLTTDVQAVSYLRSFLKQIVSLDSTYSRKNAKENYDALNDYTKGQIKSVMVRLSQTARKEAIGEIESGSTQKLVNRIFYEGKDESSTDTEMTQQTIEKMTKKINELSKDDDISAKDFIAQMAAILSGMATTIKDEDTTFVDTTSCETNSGFVMVQLESGKCGIALNAFADKIDDIVDVFENGIRETVEDVIIIPPVVTPPVDVVPQEPAIDPIPDTDPEVPPVTDEETPPTETDPETPPVTDGGDTEETPPSTDPATDETTAPAAPDDEATAPIEEPPADPITEDTAPTEETTAEDVTPVQTTESEQLRAVYSRGRNSAENMLYAQAAINASALNQRVINNAGSSELSAQRLQSLIFSEITTGLSTMSSTNTSEMLMRLNPENLGEISVKLVNASGRITVIIAASDENTVAALQQRAAALADSLKAQNQNVTTIQVMSAQEAFAAGFNMGDLNRNSQRGSENESQGYSSAADDSDISNAEVTEAVMKGANVLWQTA